MKYTMRRIADNLCNLIIHIGRRAYADALDLLFPPSCVQCTARGAWLCARCRDALFHPHRRGDCNALAATQFTGAARQLVHRTKYRGAHDAAREMAHILYDACLEDVSEHLARYPGATLALTYIPIRPTHLRMRGFNHAEKIAAESARLFNAPLIETLTYTKDIPRMAGTRTRAARATHMHGSMRTTLAEPLSNTLLIIVDDVITTGSTMREAQRALGGYTGIAPFGLAFAHTPRRTNLQSHSSPKFQNFKWK